MDLTHIPRTLNYCIGHNYNISTGLFLGASLPFPLSLKKQDVGTLSNLSAVYHLERWSSFNFHIIHVYALAFSLLSSVQVVESPLTT